MDGQLTETTSKSTSGGQSPQYTFVLDRHQSGTRSHAMREYWKQRQKKKEERQRRLRPGPRTLLPSTGPGPSPASGSERTGSSSTSMDDTYEFRDPSQHFQQQHWPHPETSESDRDRGFPGIPKQALTGMNHALSSARLDPFEMYPVQLTSEHHKLLHHWISTHATMMFDDLPVQTFNPMKDVWFPLDLSNAASFNVIMAHSAAHMAHLQGSTSTDALQYKEEALRILYTWFNDPTRALSDETFAAVIRLLTFERYWGTEVEWRVHRDGLQRMVESRGGLHALHDNWRLELVVGLVCLMTKPSWFDSSNSIYEISEEHGQMSLHPLLGTTVDLHKIRCLWLLSFIQDMRTLMSSTFQLYMEGLGVYPAVHDAVLLLYSFFQFEKSAQLQSAGYTAAEYVRIACLVFISMVLQDSLSLTSGRQIQTHFSSHIPMNNGLAALDTALEGSRQFWESSTKHLYDFLFRHFTDPSGASSKAKYAMQMTDVIEHLSAEARRGTEKCLLNMLCGREGGKKRYSVEDSWTPDSLLSSVHGE